IGRTRGRSILSYRASSVWSASVKACWQEWHRAGLACITSSGSAVSARPPPTRPRLPLRRPRRLILSGRFGFCPFEGGTLELSGVLSGRVRSSIRARNSAINLCASSSRTISVRISASFSACDSLLRSGGLLTPTLNRAARYRVNPILADHSPQAAIASRGRVEQLRVIGQRKFIVFSEGNKLMIICLANELMESKIVPEL